ncbi:MAG: hypothetical protein IRZ00_00650 [Gemmatimonadetes bacterium]|nr:hypothetical protein [Gemmatimonadota bacterium]
MSDPFSPVELRSRLRRWRHNARAPRALPGAAREAHVNADGPIVIERSPAEPIAGTSATAYDLTDGYTTERIILRP